MKDYIPRWHREIGIFSHIKPLLILEGNVLDSYQFPVDGSISKGSILRLPKYLHYTFKDLGYQCIVFYDNLKGFYNDGDGSSIDSFTKITGETTDKGRIKAEFKGGNMEHHAASITYSALTQSQIATVVIMDFASRYIVSPDNMQQSEVDSFTLLLQASLNAQDVNTDNKGILRNLLVLVVNKANDIPAWFYLQNPNVKIISLAAPTKEERETLIKGLNFKSFIAVENYNKDMKYYSTHPEELSRIQDRFVALTEGFSFTEINGLRRLCKNEKTHIQNLCDVIDLYKYGITENPWKILDTQKIRDAKAMLERRVKGQDYAITKSLDVIKRAVTGMAGLQGSSHTRPKGVLFFAGPTGTGKTETAKALAEFLFGDESCCVRFDMSEYGQSHSDQKLLGAPPGYVGYEAGGQLTNAVKKNPFSILLFDEIEKAHPSILDKFLQILEDGRMTDGQGNTVYFSETIIIFTSNLGIYKVNSSGERVENVTSNMSYHEMTKNIMSEIENYFKLQLGRPELLNRIGENIVVFDYIRANIAIQIMTAQIDRIKSNLMSEKKIELNLSKEAEEAIRTAALDNLANGGRGIGNVIENCLINPLSRYLFDNEIRNNLKIILEAIDVESYPPAVRCREG